MSSNCHHDDDDASKKFASSSSAATGVRQVADTSSRSFLRSCTSTPRDVYTFHVKTDMIDYVQPGVHMSTTRRTLDSLRYRRPVNHPIHLSTWRRRWHGIWLPHLIRVIRSRFIGLASDQVELINFATPVVIARVTAVTRVDWYTNKLNVKCRPQSIHIQRKKTITHRP